ncbi:hypothetical protein R1sor_026816 [Riccia sorocarpa]|uniref:Bet v I/Major latex protein domain-containing protein n=1 Tax=Riccia sorocarpa TaxID=122646 RepID=A0ABD3GD71_9MARC
MVSFDFEVVVDVPLARLWAAVKDSNKIMPAALPKIFDSIEHVEGVDGEAGAVRRINFGPVLPPGSYVKEKLVSIDQANKTVVAEEVEGGHLAIGFSKWVAHLKLTEEGDKTKLSFNFDVEGEGPAVGPAIEQVKLGTPMTMNALAKHIIDHGLYA